MEVDKEECILAANREISFLLKENERLRNGIRKYFEGKVGKDFLIQLIGEHK